jgi:quercetin dioxygenase-like cupin family protein
LRSVNAQRHTSENFTTASVWRLDFDAMKLPLVLVLLVCTAFLLMAAASGAKVTYIPHDKVPQNGTMIRDPNFTVMVVTRNTRGEVEIHDKETDTFHVLDGSATFVIGGTMIGGKVTAPGQQRGKDMTGGQTYHLTKGDVIVIPAGIPHWFKEVPQPITYYVVKIIKQ